jgi:hypothetical protein
MKHEESEKGIFPCHNYEVLLSQNRTKPGIHWTRSTNKYWDKRIEHPKKFMLDLSMHFCCILTPLNGRSNCIDHPKEKMDYLRVAGLLSCGF